MKSLLQDIELKCLSPTSCRKRQSDAYEHRKDKTSAKKVSHKRLHIHDRKVFSIYINFNILLAVMKNIKNTF